MNQQIEHIADLTRKIQLASAGDPTAISETIELVAGHIHSLVSKIRRSFPGVRHLENTEADTTEVFLRLLIKDRKSDRPYQNRKAFLNACFTTARNLLIDRLRWYQRQASSLDSVKDTTPMSDAESPAEQAQLADEIRLLQVTLTTLDEEEYALISLIYFEGYSQTDAFRKLDLAESTGRNRLRNVKAKLADAMK